MFVFGEKSFSRRLFYFTWHASSWLVILTKCVRTKEQAEVSDCVWRRCDWDILFPPWSSCYVSWLTTGKEAWCPTQKWNTCQVFLCIFQKNSAMATLGLKEMGKFLWEGSHSWVLLELVAGSGQWVNHNLLTSLKQQLLWEKPDTIWNVHNTFKKAI